MKGPFLQYSNFCFDFSIKFMQRFHLVGDKEKKFGGWDNQQLQDYSDNPMEKPNGLPFK